MAQLSPLLHEHVNMLGRYDFTLSEGIAAGQLRLLRNPTSVEEQLAQLPWWESMFLLLRYSISRLST